MNDAVNHPAHYNQGKYETIDIIQDIVSYQQDSFVAYLLGNVIKYVSRAGHKDDEVQDLKKAEWYLKKAIEHLNINQLESKAVGYTVLDELKKHTDK